MEFGAALLRWSGCEIWRRVATVVGVRDLAPCCNGGRGVRFGAVLQRCSGCEIWRRVAKAPGCEIWRLVAIVAGV